MDTFGANDAPLFGEGDEDLFGDSVPSFGQDDAPLFGADDEDLFAAPPPRARARSTMADFPSPMGSPFSTEVSPDTARVSVAEREPPERVVPPPEMSRLGHAASAFGRPIGQAVSDVIRSVPIDTARASMNFLAVADRIDRGEQVPDIEDAAGYQYMTPEQRTEYRAQLEQSIDPSKSRLWDVADAAQMAAEELTPKDPYYEQEPGAAGFLTETVPSALGSTAPYIAATAVTRRPYLPAALGSAQGAVAQFKDAMDKGADLPTALRASGMGAIVGTAEVVPLLGWLNRFNHATGGRVGRVLLQAMEEGGQEAVSAGMQNLIASGLYDPERDLLEGVAPQAGAGSAAGGILQLLTEAFIPGKIKGGAGAVQPVQQVRGVQPEGAEAEVLPGMPRGVSANTPSNVPAGATPAEDLIGATPGLAVPPAGQQPAGGAPSARADLQALLDDPRPLAEILKEQRQFKEARQLQARLAQVQAERQRLQQQNLSNRLAPQIAAVDARRAEMEAQARPLLGALQQRQRLQQHNVGGRFNQQIGALEREIGTLRQRLGLVRGTGTATDPVRLGHPDDLGAGADLTARPTPDQAGAGNYRKRHVTFAEDHPLHGLQISIETEQGQVREGVGKDGRKWSVAMPAPYGYVRRTTGRDGDQVDVYLGAGDDVFVIDQIDPETRKFDEHKVMLGFDEQTAMATYDAAFSDGSGPRRVGAVTRMSFEQFKDWLRTGNTRRALKYTAPKAAEKPQSLVAFIQRAGGIKDVGGELSALDAVRQRPGLVNNRTGLHPDRIREMAEEAGFIRPGRLHETTTVNDLLDAVIAELGGQRVVRERDADAELDYQAERQMEMARDIAERDVDHAISELGLVGLADAEIAEAVDLVLQGSTPDVALEHVVIKSTVENRPETAHGIDDEAFPPIAGPVAGEAPEPSPPSPSVGESAEQRPDAATTAAAPEERDQPGETGVREAAAPGAPEPAPIAPDDSVRQPLTAQQATRPQDADEDELFWLRELLQGGLGPSNWGSYFIAKGYATQYTGSRYLTSTQRGRARALILAEQEKRPEAKPEPAPQTEGDKNDRLVILAHAVADGIDKNRDWTSADLQQLADSIMDGTLAEGAYDRKDLYDAVELGVNLSVRRHRQRIDPQQAAWENAATTTRAIRRVIDKLPTQTVRSQEQVQFQQFSTPPDYGYAVAWVANIGHGDTILEPSAGTGNIAAPAMNALPRAVFLNELSPRRAAMLRELRPTADEVARNDGIGRFHVFTEDAEQLNNILPADVRPTVVVMNPPFSQTAGRMGDKRDLMVAARHIEQALKRLADGGRLVAIVGGGTDNQVRKSAGMAFDAPAYQEWWRKIRQTYRIRANVLVSGDVYVKNGTNFRTRLLVIDKVGPTAGRGDIVEGPPDRPVASIPELIQTLDGVRNARAPAQVSRPEPRPAQPSGAAAPPRGEAGSRQPGGPTPPRAGGVGAGAGGTGAAARPGSDERPADARQPTAGDRPRQGDEVPGAGQRGEAEPRPAAGTGVEPAGGGAAAPRGDLGQTGRDDTGAAAGAASPRLDVEAAGPQVRQGELTESVYEDYEPERLRIPGAKPHPGPLVQSAAMASVSPPVPTHKPALPPRVVENGELSSAQLEPVVYAGQAHAKMLPAAEPTEANPNPVEERRGFFIGDGTGVGKGREVAGIILDNWNQGRTKAVWVSEKKRLINDARRDWKGLGQNERLIFDAAKTPMGEKLTAERGIGFITYDTLKSGMEDAARAARGGFARGQKVTTPDGEAVIAAKPTKDDTYRVKFSDGSDRTYPKSQLKAAGEVTATANRLQQLVDWLGKDFDGVIVFDEAHNLANAVSIKGERGDKEASQKALAGIALQDMLPKARIVYSSATGATEVENLAYAKRLGLWGRGTAFASMREFLTKIKDGGIAAMELVARDMKALGLYIARNLSYDGVEYDRLEHTLTADQREVYDELAGAWQIVLQNINAALEATGVVPGEDADGKGNRQARSAVLSAFWGAHQRFFNQVITSMQMPSILREVQKDLDAGRQAVLQLVNTNEASTERAVIRAMEQDEDIEDLDITPRDQLMEFVNKSFPVQQFEEFEDENGNVRSRPVYDSEGRPVLNPEAVAMRDELLVRIASIRVPAAPLDLVLDHFGVENVGEVTGRKRRFIRQPDPKTGEMKRVEESRSSAANVADTAAFQDGKKTVLVFSNAGGTGASYHADKGAKSKNARRVHYLVQAGWRADTAVQGFGRTHRTNQESAPIFRLVTTDLKGQKRFISSIARRLAQLGALTKGQRQAGDQGAFTARDNLESPEARDALRVFFRRLYNGDLDGITLDEFEGQTGLNLRQEKEGNVSLKEQLPPVEQFLNRLLSMKIDQQNLVFEHFDRILNSIVERKIADGTFDKGVQTLRADKVEKVSEQVVYTHPETGAETKHVHLRTSYRNRPYAWTDVQSFAPTKFVRSMRSGTLYAVKPGSDWTDADGKVIPTYRRMGVLDRDTMERDKIDNPREWSTVRNVTADTWAAEVKKAPEFSISNEHLITGTVLPIWDRLGDGKPEVLRTQTDAGERLLGRRIPVHKLEQVLERMGAKGVAAEMSPAEIVDAVLRQGKEAELGNGWRIVKRVVANEPRMEIVGPNTPSEGQQLVQDGAIRELIGYKARYFIPAGAKAEAVFNRITKYRPVVKISGSKIKQQRAMPLLQSRGPSLREGDTKQQRAYHGTRHDFDRFELSDRTALTGEGAMAYGYGLYFAGKKEIAEYYKRKLTEESTKITIDGEDVLGWSGILKDKYYTDPVAREALGLIDTMESVEAAIRHLDMLVQGGRNSQLSEASPPAAQILEWVERHRRRITVEKKPGRLYEVEIPENEDFLDWDKPLSEQSEKVKAALETITGTLGMKALGREYYRSLAGDEGSDRGASMRLKAAGIPGHRFQDASSRGFRGDYELALNGKPILDAAVDDGLSADARDVLRKYVGATSKPETIEGFLRSDAGVDEILRKNRGGAEALAWWQKNKANIKEAVRTYNYVVYTDEDVSIIGKQQRPERRRLTADTEGVYRGDTAGKRRRVQMEITRLLQQYVGDAGVRVQVADKLWDAQEGSSFWGGYNAGEALITVALASPDAAWTGRHEIIHVMRDLGLIPDVQWRALEKAADLDWMTRYAIRGRYSELSREEQLEEAIAEAFGDHRSGKRKAERPVASFFERLARILRGIVATLRRVYDAEARETEAFAREVFADIEAGVYRAAGPVRSESGKVAAQKAITTGGLFVTIGGGRRYEVGSLEEASRKFEQVRDAAGTGGSETPTPLITNSAGELIGYISYNGRIWPGHPRNWKPGDKPIYDNRDIIDAEPTPEPRRALASEPTDQGEQLLIPGVAPTKAAPKKKPKPQKGVEDLPLFDVNARKQTGMKFQRTSAARKQPATVTVNGQQMPSAEVRQANMQNWLSRGQPIDRAIRMPFDWMGGVDEQGRWNAGKFVTKAARKVIREWEPSDTGRMAFMNPILHAARAGWLDRYGLEPEYITRDRQRALGERRIMLRGAEILKSLKEQKVGLAEARVLQAILTGETVGAEDMARLAAPIRQAIDDLGAEAVSMGLLSAESYERNRGAYLHRVYMKHERDATVLARWVGKFMGGRRKKIIGDELRGRGIFLELDMPRVMRDVPGYREGETGGAVVGQRMMVLDRLPEQGELEVGERTKEPRPVDRVFWPADQAVPDRFADYTNRGTWEVRQVRGRRVTLWRDYTKPEREKMGEILDARYTIGKTFMLMAHDLATGRFYKDIATNEEWAQSSEPAAGAIDAEEWQRGRHRYVKRAGIEWVKVPESTLPDSGGKKRWGALAGMWVREEIWRDLNELAIMNRPHLWRQVLTQWKLNKTARSPVVHMNNVMSNLVLMDMADVRLQDLVNGVRAYATGNADYQDAVDHGVFGVDMMSAEIRKEVLEPVLKELQAEITGGKAVLPLGALGKLAERIWGWAKAVDSRLVDAYRIEDDVFRMASYMRHKATGLSPADAAAAAREEFIDYDIRAPWVNALRNSILPFISYTYRAVPLVARMIATRPWKFAKYATIAYLANALAYMLEPGDEDDERRSMREEERGYTWLGSPRMIRMPWRDDYGNPVFLDIRRWIPAGDVFDVGQGGAFADIPAPLRFGGPLIIGAELFLNRSAFTGEDIFNEQTDDFWARQAKRLGYVYQAAIPSAAWVPGSWYWSKIEGALTGERDYKGRPLQPEYVIPSAFGVKLKPQDVESGFAFQRMDVMDEVRANEEQARQLAKDLDRNRISKDAYDRKMKRIEGRIKTLSEKYETLKPKAPTTGEPTP